MAAFSLGSLLCGMAVTLPAVVAARAVQGAGGAAAMANNMGIITESFPARERGRALGILASFVALGMMCGPVLGGFIVSVLPWEFIFLINVPVGVVSLVVGLKTLPRVRPERGRSLDVVGSLPIVPGIMLTFFALTSLQAGASPALVAMLAAGVALLVLFALVERRAQDPLVVLEVFSQRSFLVNVACLFISFVAIGVYELMTPFYLQDARGFSPTLAGLVFCVIPLANAVSGPISGAVSDRIGCELPTCVGMLLFAVGLALVGLFGVDTGLPCILACLALASLGTSIFQSPNNSLIMGSLPPEALGVRRQRLRPCALSGYGRGHLRLDLASVRPDERRRRRERDVLCRRAPGYLPVWLSLGLRRDGRLGRCGIRPDACAPCAKARAARGRD